MTRPLEVLKTTVLHEAGRTAVSCRNSLVDICPMRTAELFAENKTLPLLPPPLPHVSPLAHYLYIEGLIKEGNSSQIFL